MRTAILRLLALCSVVGAGAPQAKADVLADFYKGRTVTVVVSSSAGGGYDTLARALARYMGRHMPGHPIFVVRNMPGAGGLYCPLKLRAFQDEFEWHLASPAMPQTSHILVL